METLKVSLSPRPGSPPPAPPDNGADLPLGFDIYEGNGAATETEPTLAIPTRPALRNVKAGPLIRTSRNST